MRGIQVVSRSQALEQLDQSRASGGALRLGSRVVLRSIPWDASGGRQRVQGEAALACGRCRGCVSSAANRELVLSTDNYSTRDRADDARRLTTR